MKRLLVTVSIPLVLLCSSPAFADIVQLSFAGTVDTSGATLGGVSAPLGSPFTLDVGIDDSMAGTGFYDVDSISYTLVLGTYDTVTDWTAAGLQLVATQNGMAIQLVSDPEFADFGEHFLLNLTGFGPSSFDDPLTWGGPAMLSGDIIVRGIGGFDSPDQLSGNAPYEGTLVLTVIPEPSSTALLGVCLIGAWVRRRRS